MGFSDRKRDIGRRPDGLAEVVPGAGVAHEAHDLKANAPASRVHLLEPLSDGILRSETGHRPSAGWAGGGRPGSGRRARSPRSESERARLPRPPSRTTFRWDSQIGNGT